MAPEKTATLATRRRSRQDGLAERPFLFLALTSSRLLASPARFALADTDSVLIGRGAETSARRTTAAGTRELSLSIGDPRVSSSHARLTRVANKFILEDLKSKNGVIVNGARAERATLTDGDLLELGDSFFLYRELAVPKSAAEGDLTAPAGGAAGLTTLVPAFAAQLARLAEVARSTVPVILHGETGTGKELLAREIHRLSARTGDFTAVNSGALPANLLETELFGYRRGAFSGADEDRPGLIKSSDRGTLFLDEVGDLPLGSQAAFLRVLQEQEVLAVGATKPVKVDLRVVAASHRELTALVESSAFRADLLARLSGLTVELPPLRARLEDLGVLTRALILRLAPDRAARLELTHEAARALFLHPWPMNVRELEKCLATAIVLAREDPIDLAHLPEALAALVAPEEEAEESGPTAGRPEVLSAEDEARKGELVALLAAHHGNITAVARELGKARMQIQRWIKRFGIDAGAYRT